MSAPGAGQESRIDRYGLLLFLHVLGAIVWIGLGLAGHAFFLWAAREGDYGFLAKLNSAVKWIEPPSIVLGPLILLATGSGLVLDGPWGFGDWVLVGIGGYVAALVLGGALQAPGTKRLDAILAERGPEELEAIALGRRLSALMWPELAILLVVPLAMTTKPTGGGSTGFWALTTAMLGGAALLAARGFRAAQAPAETLP